MTDVNYTIRVMKEDEVPQALDIWRETGMEEGTHCIYTWLKVDPEAFHVAVTDEGELIATCSGCIHHDNLAFVGLYAVRKKFRGLGIGIKVWKAAMKHIGDINTAINAVPGKLELYRDKGGFPIEERDWVSLVNETHEKVQHENLSDALPHGVDIEPYEDSHLSLIYEYDRNLIGYSRELILQLTFKEQDSRTYVALKDGSCVGFGTIKMSCQGDGQVGPLYADDKEVAEAILKKLLISLPQAEGFAMMTISSNESANQIIKKLRCPTTEECPRLYRKEKLIVDTSKVFAHLDLNFSPY